MKHNPFDPFELSNVDDDEGTTCVQCARTTEVNQFQRCLTCVTQNDYQAQCERDAYRHQLFTLERQLENRPKARAPERFARTEQVKVLEELERLGAKVDTVDAFSEWISVVISDAEKTAVSLVYAHVERQMKDLQAQAQAVFNAIEYLDTVDPDQAAEIQKVAKQMRRLQKHLKISRL